VICALCGSENEVGAKFCERCGTAFGARCPSCAAPIRPGARFCRECGGPLGAEPPLAAVGPRLEPAPTGIRPAPRDDRPSRDRPIAERRLVSILFNDLVGFTALVDGHDPEETRELLTRYFDLARVVVERYGGTIEKFIGDAVMAVWGAPVAREDDAERAVRAGLDLVDAVRALGPSLTARAAVVTGEAAVTLGAQSQGMVAGDLVNLASRLQTAAGPGTVLVAESTMRAASAAIAFEAAGLQVLKGIESPVSAFRALRVIAERGGRNRTESLEAPFVGRDEELRLLKDQFHATGRERRARLVSIVGPAGIGKSRLAWEFLKYIDGLVEDVWWHQGRSPAYGDGITFWALGEMVRSRAGLAATDDEATTRARIAATVAEFVPDEAEQRWIEPALLTLLGVGDLRPGGTEQLFAAWRTFFERIAADGTVLLLFEDLHWADAGLLDFIDHLLEWSRGYPIYVVTLTRPELLERRTSWGAGTRHFTSIFLEPLAEPAMRSLLEGLVPGLPEEAVRAIVARADGVPLYAVETVRMLVADGKLIERDGRYRPSGDLRSLAVPETLHALIAARLDALEPADRSLLADAAVLGQSFSRAGLMAVSGLDEAEIDPSLRTLVRRELLVLEADPRSPDRGQYTFVQALIREVAYGTVAKRDRKRRHLAAARFFESLGTDELAGALATHYLAAFQNASDGAEAETLASQARLSLRGAAERAAALGSHQQAVGYFRQAFEVTSDPVERAALLERTAESASLLGRYGDAATDLRAALELHRKCEDRVAAARATGSLGRILLEGFQAELALPLLEAAAAEFADLGDDPAVVQLEGQLARACFLGGDNRRAIEAADRVLERAERIDLVEVVADTLITRGAALANLGRVYEGAAVTEGGIRLAASHGLAATELRGLLNLGAVQSMGDPIRALASCRNGLEVANRLGRIDPTLSANAAEAAISTGDWTWALAELERARSGAVEPADRFMLAVAETEVRVLRGETIAEGLEELRASAFAAAESMAAAMDSTLRASVAFANGDLDGSAYVESVRQATMSPLNAPQALDRAGDSALWARDLVRARHVLDMLLATGVHGPRISVRIAALRAGIAALEGQQADAVGGYRTALADAREVGLPWDEALIAIGFLTLVGPAQPAARAAGEAAREILVRLGARPFIARLDAALGTPAPGATAMPRSDRVVLPTTAEA